MNTADMEQLMTDADFERALDALHADGIDADVGDLLRAMNENRIISWEEAERILCDASNEPVKSSLPQQTRPTEPDNDTDVDMSIRRLLKNDPKLVEINLNNMKRTPIPQIKRILEALRENTFLERISLANMGLYDTDVAPLIDVIEDNETLRAVNVETNYLSGDFFARLLRAALKNQTLEEIKAVNQGVSFSTAAEREIMEAVFENRGLTKVSINLRLPEGRHKIEQATIRNQEIRRILRRQAAEAARAAEAAEAEKAVAKAARMGDISPGKISTVGKPPTKKQMAAMAESQPSTSTIAMAPIINPHRIEDRPRPTADKPVLRRLNQPVDMDDNVEIPAVPTSPSSIPPMILGQLNRAVPNKEAPEHSNDGCVGRSTASMSGIHRGVNVDDNDEPHVPSSPTKTKPIVRKLSTDLENMYKSKDNNEGKVAYIPEAPVGRASLIAKKFEKKEASARREVERSTRRLSATKKPSDYRFNVPAIVPGTGATSKVPDTTIPPSPEKQQTALLPSDDVARKGVSKWRQRKNDENQNANDVPQKPTSPANQAPTNDSVSVYDIDENQRTYDRRMENDKEEPKHVSPRRSATDSADSLAKNNTENNDAMEKVIAKSARRRLQERSETVAGQMHARSMQGPKTLDINAKRHILQHKKFSNQNVDEDPKITTNESRGLLGRSETIIDKSPFRSIKLQSAKTISTISQDGIGESRIETEQRNIRHQKHFDETNENAQEYRRIAENTSRRSGKSETITDKSPAYSVKLQSTKTDKTDESNNTERRTLRHQKPVELVNEKFEGNTKITTKSTHRRPLQKSETTVDRTPTRPGKLRASKAVSRDKTYEPDVDTIQNTYQHKKLFEAANEHVEGDIDDKAETFDKKSSLPNHENIELQNPIRVSTSKAIHEDSLSSTEKDIYKAEKINDRSRLSGKKNVENSESDMNTPNVSNDNSQIASLTPFDNLNGTSYAPISIEVKPHVYEPLTTRPKRIYGDLKQVSPKLRNADGGREKSPLNRDIENKSPNEKLQLTKRRNISPKLKIDASAEANKVKENITIDTAAENKRELGTHSGEHATETNYVSGYVPLTTRPWKAGKSSPRANGL